ncbi:SH3 domain-containing kinase-binding protein 1 isoform X2 [Ischnura elegans]|uniref:SH3 domain-containing kinase-binding protein 1 isoform X2 n=1 Tax=Ischnura elegans TaxID=197161 RepID=UPI001ED89191|nr:SH3 domain-containing kinase-binding protein 1 isoform X2 [Ischnura elegans]
MVEALVEFDYAAQAPDELTLKKGDIITAIKTEPGNGWWEGSLKGRRGLFPDNFVKVIKKDAPTESHKDEKNGVVLRSGSKRRCRAIFSYKPVNEDELELKVNDLIEFISEVEEGWWKGRLRSKVGVFPSNFVQEEVVTESLLSDASEKSVPKTKGDSKRLTKEYCRVLFPYEAANEDELTLTKGDTVLILSKVVQDKGWWKGELKGKIGVFPDNFVELIPADVGPKKADRLTGGTAITDAGAKAALKSEPAHQHEATTSHSEPVESPSKGDDKPQIPPIPGKKPQLPPPYKKPARPSAAPPPSSGASGMSAIKRISGEFEAWGAAGDSPDGARMSCMSKSNSHTNPVSAVRLRRVEANVPAPAIISESAGGLPPSGEMDFDSVERSAMLSHPTASRAKAPRRRPPSAMFPGKESEGGGMMNGTSETDEAPAEALRTHVENGAASEDSAKEVEGTPAATANGGSVDLREKKSPAGAASRPPFMEELKMSQAKRGTTTAASGGTKPSPVQPSAAPPASTTTTTPPRHLSQVSPPHPHPGHGVHIHHSSEAVEKVGQVKQQQRSFQSRMEEVDASSSTSTSVHLSTPPLAHKETSPRKPPRKSRKPTYDGDSSLDLSDGDGDLVIDEILGSGKSTTVISGASHVSISSTAADSTSGASAPFSAAVDTSAPAVVSSRISVGEGPAPTAVTRRPVSAYASDTPSQRRVAAQFSSWQEPIPDGDSVKVTPQMYRELRERVEQLENSLESQSERFTQMFNQLKEELSVERERRKILQESVNQLQSLLTHV